MTLHGHFENGVVVLDETAAVPDGVKVVVHIASEPSAPQGGEAPKITRFGRLIGQATDLPPDAAGNVDHYLYGAPKQ